MIHIHSMNRIFSILLGSLCLCSCASRLTTVPATSNNLNIDLMDPAVSYSRIEDSLDAFSAFGFYTGGDRDLDYDTDILLLEGSSKQLVTGKGLGILSGLSLLGLTISVHGTLGAFGTETGPDNSGLGFFRFLPSLLIAGTLNETLWRPANVRRAKSEALMEAVRNSTVSDFYTNPRVETTMKTRLISTKYQVKSRMISGNFPENSIQRDRLLDRED